MKQLILTLFALFLALPASANNFELKVGTYANGKYTITVRAEYYEREGVDRLWYEIRASGSDGDGRQHQFVAFYFDPLSGNASKTPWREGPGKSTAGNHIPAGDYTLESSRQDPKGMTFFWKLGGLLHIHDQKTQMRINPKTGEILAIGTDHKIAWGTPSGWHSGPYKEEFSRFVAEGFAHISDAWDYDIRNKQLQLCESSLTIEGEKPTVIE